MLYVCVFILDAINRLTALNIDIMHYNIINEDLYNAFLLIFILITVR